MEKAVFGLELLPALYVVRHQCLFHKRAAFLVAAVWYPLAGETYFLNVCVV